MSNIYICFNDFLLFNLDSNFIYRIKKLVLFKMNLILFYPIFLWMARAHFYIVIKMVFTFLHHTIISNNEASISMQLMNSLASLILLLFLCETRKHLYN